MTIATLNSASMLDKRFPGAWDVSTGRNYKIAHKQYGKFIATILTFPGEPTLWRVKEMQLVADADINSSINKVYKTKRSGRAPTMKDAMDWITHNVLPILFSLSDIRSDMNAKESVKEILG